MFKIPISINKRFDIDQLNDREKVFLSLLCYLSKEEELGTWLNFHSQDLAIIFNYKYPHTVGQKHPLEGLIDWQPLDRANVSVRLNREMFPYSRMGVKVVEIRDEEAIRIFHYLMGRVSSHMVGDFKLYDVELGNQEYSNIPHKLRNYVTPRVKFCTYQQYLKNLEKEK